MRVRYSPSMGERWEDGRHGQAGVGKAGRQEVLYPQELGAGAEQLPRCSAAQLLQHAMRASSMVGAGARPLVASRAGSAEACGA